MKSKNIIRYVITVASAVLLTATLAVAKDKLESKAKVSKADAEKTALAKVPGGKVKEAELEEEDGKLIWSFDIATKGTKDITEVHVDAMTGEVVKSEVESAADEAKEKKEETKEKKGEKDDDDKNEKK
jgi:hypothetical protein